jgi:hypothetical protein
MAPPKLLALPSSLGSFMAPPKLLALPSSLGSFMAPPKLSKLFPSLHGTPETIKSSLLPRFIHGTPETPKASPELAAQIEAQLEGFKQRENGWREAVAHLAEAGDPKTGAELAPNDWYRMRRALEIVLVSGGTDSSCCLSSAAPVYDRVYCTGVRFVLLRYIAIEFKFRFFE